MKPSEVYHKAVDIAIIESVLDSEEQIRERRETIANNPHSFKRMGALAVHRLVHFVGAEQIRDMHERQYRKLGLNVLGHGYTATALMIPGSGEVRKFVRRSENLTNEEREEFVRNLAARIAINTQHHPDIALQTDIEIAPSPIRERPAVYLVQPYVVITNNNPDRRQVKDFAAISIEEMMQSGFLPDIKGRQNLVNTTEGLSLIDTEPISQEENERTFLFCAEKLEQMAITGELHPAS